MITFRFRSIRARLFVLAAVIAAALIGNSWYAWLTLSATKVNGPAYLRIVQGKDLIADILPPPAYVVEAYLIVSTMDVNDTPEVLEKKIARFDGLKKDFHERMQFWKDALPQGPRKQQLLDRAGPPAVAFLDVVDKEYLPALKAKDAPKAAQILAEKLPPLFAQHRAEIEKLAQQSSKILAEDEAQVADLIRTRSWIQIVLAVILVIVVTGMAVGLGAAMQRRSAATVAVVEAIAEGDLARRLAVGVDEFGRIGAAVNRTAEALVQEKAARQEAAQRERHQNEELRLKVEKILEVVNSAGRGDLTQAVPVRGADAIGQMGDGLAGFFERLRGSVGNIAAMAQTLASSSHELTAVSQQMASNAEETAAQAGVASAAAEEVSINISTVSTAAEEMGASIREIAKSAHEAARVATTAVRVAETTNATIAKLGDSSAEIGNVVKVITSIAQQTNLLALNATIEAARAGEAGKGFAVVANEVKELAKQTARATDDISGKIEAIQADTSGAVAAIAQISKIINQINDLQNTIASAVEQQTATTGEIGRNVGEAAKGSSEIAQNVTGVAQAARSTTEGASNAKCAADELARIAADLQKLVGQFKY